MRNASVIDYPRTSLDPEIWDTSQDPPILNDNIRDEIVDIVYSALDDVGIPDTAVNDIFVYGSLLGNQFNIGTDLDARIVLNPERLPEGFSDVSGDKIYELIRDQIHNITLGDTNHPFNATVVVTGDETTLDKSPLGKTEEDPVYNVMVDAWVVEPFLKDDEFDPDEEFSDARGQADEVMDRLDEIFRETKNDAIDYSLIEEALSDVSDKAKFEKKLDAKLEEIENNLEKAVEEYERIKNERTDAYSEGKRHSDPKNVEMKYLERYKYWDMLKKIKHILKDGVSEQEVETLEETVASKLKLSAEYLRLFEQGGFTPLFFDFWAQFSPAEALNFWDLGMNRGQVAQMLGQVPLRGTYRITDDQIMFDNPRDAQAVWEYFTLNM